MTEPIEQPLHFYHIFAILRHYKKMTLHEMACAVKYDIGVIRINEAQTLNPSLKTLNKYVEGLDLELYISKRGLTITDLLTNAVVVDNWPLDNIK